MLVFGVATVLTGSAAVEEGNMQFSLSPAVVAAVSTYIGIGAQCYSWVIVFQLTLLKGHCETSHVLF